MGPMLPPWRRIEPASSVIVQTLNLQLSTHFKGFRSSIDAVNVEDPQHPQQLAVVDRRRRAGSPKRLSPIYTLRALFAPLQAAFPNFTASTVLSIGSKSHIPRKLGHQRRRNGRTAGDRVERRTGCGGPEKLPNQRNTRRGPATGVNPLFASFLRDLDSVNGT